MRAQGRREIEYRRPDAVELRQLQYLARIARVGGFRRAADELDMSQATLSEQIKLLEQELGVRLFERGGRNLSLTEPGKVLLERAERVLDEVRAAQAEMQEFAHLDRGQLLFGTMSGVGTAWLPSFLAAFMRQHPQRRPDPGRARQRPADQAVTEPRAPRGLSPGTD